MAPGNGVPTGEVDQKTPVPAYRTPSCRLPTIPRYDFQIGYSREKHSIPMLQSRSNCLEKHHKCDTIGRRGGWTWEEKRTFLSTCSFLTAERSERVRGRCIRFFTCATHLPGQAASIE